MHILNLYAKCNYGFAETTGKGVEVSHGKYSSKSTEDIVSPLSVAITNISLAGRENNMLITRGENQGIYCNSLMLFVMV